MTRPDPDRLAALRAAWHAARAAGDTERLVEIEDEAAEIKAVHLLQNVLGATVGTDTPE